MGHVQLADRQANQGRKVADTNEEATGEVSFAPHLYVSADSLCFSLIASGRSVGDHASPQEDGRD